MKTLVTLMVGALLFVASGCTSTLVLGPKANKEKCVNGSVGWNHVDVTLPLVRVGSKLHESE